MDRPTFVLAAMAAAGAEARFDPVRLQKYFFLLDRELDAECGGPHFDFRPYQYGPFDRAVYAQFDRLAREGLAVVDKSRQYRLYSLSEEGFERGKRAAASLPERASRYMASASAWLFSLDVPALLLSIYEYAPNMAIQAVRPEVVETRRLGAWKAPFLRGMGAICRLGRYLEPFQGCPPFRFGCSGSALERRGGLFAGGHEARRFAGNPSRAVGVAP